MDKLKTIICGIDFSKGSQCALRQAARIGETTNARLLAVHVLEESLLKVFPSISRAEIKTRAADQLDELVFEILGDSHKAEQHVLIGHPFRTIADLVIGEDCDLLALGVHGHDTKPDAATAAGALASKCVRKVPTKVLLVRGDQRSDFKKIVHCTDFSKTSALALEQAIIMAHEEKASLEILHAAIAPERIAYGIADAQFYKVLDPEIVRKQNRIEMEEYLKPFAEEVEGLDLKTTIIESLDSTGTALLNAIRERDADLIVLGTHGRGTIAGLLMGTTAEKIVSHAPCSVLAIKPKHFKVFW